MLVAVYSAQLIQRNVLGTDKQHVEKGASLVVCAYLSRCHSAQGWICAIACTGGFPEGKICLGRIFKELASVHIPRHLVQLSFLGLAVSLVQSRGRCADRSRLSEILDSDGILFNKEHVYGLLTRRFVSRCRLAVELTGIALLCKFTERGSLCGRSL